MSALTIVLAVPLFATTLQSSDVNRPEPQTVEISDGKISIAIPEKDGLYKYKFGKVRFMVVRKNKLVRAALDYCYICPPMEYGYNGSQLICKNCSAPVAPATVGKPGGCNPRVIDYTKDSDSLTFIARNLKAKWNK